MAERKPRPEPIERRMPSGPPMRATHFTRRRSVSENSMPIENIRRATPISAKSSSVCKCATVGPGVNGPTRSPATTYPRMSG